MCLAGKNSHICVQKITNRELSRQGSLLYNLSDIKSWEIHSEKNIFGELKRATIDKDRFDNHAF